MAYKKSPASFMKHKSKAVGYMAAGSAFHLDPDPDPDTDPKKETLVSSTTTKTRETTPEGLAGTRTTLESKFETPGGKVKRTPEGDAAYASLSQEQKDAQDAKFKAKQRSEVKSRFTFDPIEVPKTGVDLPKQELKGEMPKRIDTVIGGGDYKFDISNKPTSYVASSEVKQAFGGGTTTRYGLGESEASSARQRSLSDKATKTGGKNIMKITQTQGDFQVGRSENEKAQYLLNKEKAKETEQLYKAFRSIGAGNITDEDKSNYGAARENILNKYKKLSSDITKSYRPISQGGGGEHRYTKRIKAISKPMYNSETGLDLFNKNK